MPGFEEAGGFAGTGLDYLRNPAGDPALAASYMRKAGFASGRVNGERIVMIGSVDSPAKEAADVIRAALESLGFDVRLRLVDQSIVVQKFCGVVKEMRRIDVCANMGWIPDFSDPYAMLNANFNGGAIVAVNNNNPSLFDDPQINAAMDKAALIRDPRRRAKAWGEIDRRLVERVAAIPFLWDRVANVVSKDVYGVIAQWNGVWDLSYMSLK
jgi:peptide/nickel transport system substrate-binding protein